MDFKEQVDMHEYAYRLEITFTQLSFETCISGVTNRGYFR